MTRVTVEDYLNNVDSRLELIMLTTRRAHRLAIGDKEPKVAWEDDKLTIVALHEITSGLVNEDIVQQEDIVENGPLFAASDDEASIETL